MGGNFSSFSKIASGMSKRIHLSPEPSWVTVEGVVEGEALQLSVMKKLWRRCRQVSPKFGPMFGRRSKRFGVGSGRCHQSSGEVLAPCVNCMAMAIDGSAARIQGLHGVKRF